jgi:hypothetical protein
LLSLTDVCAKCQLWMMFTIIKARSLIMQRCGNDILLKVELGSGDFPGRG